MLRARARFDREQSEHVREIRRTQADRRSHAERERSLLPARSSSLPARPSSGLSRSASVPDMSVRTGLFGRLNSLRGRRKTTGNSTRATANPMAENPAAAPSPPLETDQFWRSLSDYLDPAISEEERMRIRTALARLTGTDSGQTTRSVQMQWLRREMRPESYSKTEDLAFGV